MTSSCFALAWPFLLIVHSRPSLSFHNGASLTKFVPPRRLQFGGKYVASTGAIRSGTVYPHPAKAFVIRRFEGALCDGSRQSCRRRRADVGSCIDGSSSRTALSMMDPSSSGSSVIDTAVVSSTLLDPSAAITTLLDASMASGSGPAGGVVSGERSGATRDVLVFVAGLIPFIWATVEFWRRIAVGEPFGTGDDSVVIIGEDGKPSSSRGRRVLGKGALAVAYVLFGVAAFAVAIALASVILSPHPPPPPLLPPSGV